MSTFLERLSSYNLFNNLLPGALFAALVTRFTEFSLLHDDIVVALFLYYFLGVVISRVGSLVVEPALKKAGFVSYADYTDYVRASKADPRIDLLLEASNTYRTLCTATVLVLAAVAADGLVSRYPIAKPWLALSLGLALVVLFAFSFRKQTQYIVKRVNGGN